MTRLSAVIGTYPHTQALTNHSVSPTGYEFDFVDIPVVQAFRRMVRGSEFDVSELSVTTYLAAKEHSKPFTAIPVFPQRLSPHRALVVNTDAGITNPKDLEGERVGVRAYTVTTGVWARAVLADQYGVDLNKVTWVIADEEHVQEFVLPGNVEAIPGADLGSMVSSGDLAGGIQVTRGETANVTPLIHDPAEKESEWVRQGIYPVNHTIVIADSVLAANPDVAENLYNAFREAKESFSAKLASGAELTDGENELARRCDLVGADPVPYGIEANRSSLEALISFARDQHILSEDISVEDLFVRGDWD